MPGARMLRMVTMMLMDPMMDDAPSKCSAKMLESMDGPICSVSGAYSVQPAAGAPPGKKNDVASSKAAGIINQKLKLFNRAKAMLATMHMMITTITAHPLDGVAGYLLPTTKILARCICCLPFLI